MNNFPIRVRLNSVVKSLQRHYFLRKVQKFCFSFLRNSCLLNFYLRMLLIIIIPASISMIGNAFPCLPSAALPFEKGSLCTTNLPTSINMQSQFVPNYIPRNEHNNFQQTKRQQDDQNFLVDQQANESISYHKQINRLDNSFGLKLHELEEKSSKIISKLPNLHSKSSKPHNYSRKPVDNIFLSTSSVYSNKLKIILDLEEKIGQLQSNINNPLTCHEYMQNITKEINLNFENYYQQAKEKSEDQRLEDSVSDESSFDQKENSGRKRVEEEEEKNDFNLMVYVPKIIEIQVPFEVIKPVERSNNSAQKSSDGSEPLSINSNPNYNKQSIDHSSIQNIINQFNDKFYPSIQGQSSQKEIYVYRINKVEHQENLIMEKEEFNLPLDSYQRCESDRGEKENIHLLKKTDRSNISSSNSQLQNLRNEIWNKDEIQFNHEHLSLVKEHEHKSQHNSDNHFTYEDEEREKLLINLNQKIAILTQQNIQLKENIEKFGQQRSELLSEVKCKENRNIELEIQYLQEAEKVEQYLELNKELNEELSSHKQCISRLENQIYELNQKMKQNHKDYMMKIQQKQTQIHDLLKTLQYKTDELEDCLRTNEQIKQVLQRKEAEYDRNITDLQLLIAQQKEEINFYKAKLEEEGLNLKFEEANMIKQMIEKKYQEDKEQILVLEKSIENKYQSKLLELNSDKEILQHEVQELKRNSRTSISSIQQLSVDGKNNFLEEIQHILSNYNQQLSKKDEEIINLRKVSSQYKHQLSEGLKSEEQLKIITSIKNILIKEKMDKDNISNNMVQIVYVIDRLLNHIKIYQYAAHRERQQRVKLTKKITNMNLFFNRELEKSEENNVKLGKQSANAKKHAQQLSKQVKKLKNKLQIYQNKLEDPQSNHLYNIYQLENEYLQLQNTKMGKKYQKIKEYCEELKGNFLSQFFKEGNHMCERLCCQNHEESKEKKQEEQFQKKISEILNQLKDQYHKSVLLCPQESILQSKSKLGKFGINSSVVCVTNKPAKTYKTPAMKALMTPLPEIPNSSPTPTASITLDKLLEKRLCTSDTYKNKVTLKLLELGIDLNKVSKKLFSLKPCQVLVNYSNGQVQIILRRQYGNSMEDDESSLIYRAPQVLLGFNQSEASYVWTIGLIIDQIYHEKLFYKKINEILSHKNNYHVRNEGLSIRPVLQKMLRKNHKERSSLIKAKEELLQLLL